MNHDYTHCLDYLATCPKECFRAELERDLIDHPGLYGGLWLSYAHLRETSECKLRSKDFNHDTIRQSARILLQFIESCDGNTSTLVLDDGSRLKSDWGYVEEGLQEILDWAERKEK